MHTLTAEFVKLKRSLGWAVVALLPVALVVLGSIMTIVEGTGLDGGWHTLWMRSFVFYGLFPLPVGIAMLASLVWRPEHRGSNWSALMSGPTSSLRIVAAKTASVTLLTVVMQLIALAVVILLGKLVFGLPGFVPASYLGVFALIVLACVPVAALQSWLSMVMRSFAGPVAVAFVGAGASVVALMAVGPPAMVSPYALLTRATQLGTGQFADDGAVSPTVVVMIAAASVVLTCAAAAMGTAALERGDVRTS
ncbi:ABC transporter permease [Microlunatus sp. Y2014]|uniref:ABC transporter permease n=1 Tax=Microlunatus sp. Y2014 TaxID=3418488 RepID=UPI003DA7A4A9